MYTFSIYFKILIFVGATKNKITMLISCTKLSLCAKIFLECLWFYSANSTSPSSAPVLGHFCNAERTQSILDTAVDFDKSPGLHGMQKDIVKRNAVLSGIMLRGLQRKACI